MFDGVTLGDWGQIAVAVAALIAAIVYSTRQIDKRRFACQIKMTPIIKIDGVSPNDIEISFKGQVVKTLTLYSIAVLNLGNRPILRSDWDENFKISFSSNVRIVDFRLSASAPKDLPLSLRESDVDTLSEIQFQPFLLNPAEGFLVEIVVAGGETPKITARIVGISKVEHVAVVSTPNRIMASLLLMFSLVISFVLMAEATGALSFSMLSDFITVPAVLILAGGMIFYEKRSRPIHFDERFSKRSD